MELRYVELNTCVFNRTYMYACTRFYIHVHVDANYIRVLQIAHALSPTFIDKELGLGLKENNQSNTSRY